MKFTVVEKCMNWKNIVDKKSIIIVGFLFDINITN
jgi:hypothetical protein